jgi:ABC-2 type transport system permease protein
VLKGVSAVEVIAAPDAASVEALTNERAAQLGLILPPGFDAALRADANPPLTMIVNRAQIGSDGVAQIVLTAIQAQRPRALGVDLTRRDINAAPQTGGLATSPAGFKNTFAIMSIVLLLATLGVFMVPVSIIEEKERRTLDALLVAPVSHADLIFAKAVAALLFALVMDAIVLAVNQVFVEASLPALAAVIGVGSVAAVMLGLFMGSLFNSTQSLNVWSTFAMIPFLGPVVVAVLPNASLQHVMPLVPTYHLMQGLRLALEPGADLSGLAGHLLVLALTAVVFTLGVLWLLKRREI